MLVGVGGTKVRVGARGGVVGVVVSTEAQPVDRTRRKTRMNCLSLNIGVPPDSGYIRLPSREIMVLDGCALSMRQI